MLSYGINTIVLIFNRIAYLGNVATFSLLPDELSAAYNQERLDLGFIEVKEI